MIDPYRIHIMGQRLLVKRVQTPEQSKGGLYILGRDLPAMGDVLRVGMTRTRNGRKYVTNELLKGDRVIYDKFHWGDIVTWGQNYEYFIIDLKWVYARVRYSHDGKILLKPLQGWVLVKRNG